MLSDSLSHLIETLDFAWRRASACPATLTNIQWRADACDPGSILFFQRFADGKSDGEIYERYLAASPCAVLVTNQMLDCFDAMPGKGIYVTRPGDWAETVRRFCDRVYPLDPGAPCFLGVTGTNGKTTTVKYLESMLVVSGAAGPDHRHPGRLPQRPTPRGDRLHLAAPDRAAPLAARRRGRVRCGGHGDQQPCPGPGTRPWHPLAGCRLD
jgi:hypothetical protein